jgi:hypothetical protein
VTPASWTLPTAAALTDWVPTLRARGIRITIAHDNALTLVGPADRNDQLLVDRYRHALLVAAARTHPAWWDHVAGRSTELPAHIDDIPANGDAWACACCGAPARELGGDLLAWCEEHTWTP